MDVATTLALLRFTFRLGNSYVARMGLKRKLWTWWSGEDGSSSNSFPPDGITQISDSIYSLYEPTEEPEIEIVFVHGLQLFDDKQAYWKTWTARQKDKDGKEVCWPMTWLGKELPRARILSLSYDSSALMTNTRRRMDGFFLGESLVQEMVDISNVGQQMNCPVVFVCHSLGGLVVKEIVIRAYARKFGNNSKYLTFLGNIRGFHFYATPHDGSKLADLASYGPYWEGKSKMVEKLRIIDEGLGRLNNNFEQIERDHFAKSWFFSVVAEMHKTEFYGFNQKVVEEASAQHGYNNFLSVPADHFGVCKPKTERSSCYEALTQFIMEDVMDIKNPTPAKKREIDLMLQLNVPHREMLYDNKVAEITICRIGDMAFSFGSLSDMDFKQRLKESMSSMKKILFKMEVLLKEVRIWRNQCEYLVQKYREGVDKIGRGLHTLISTMEERPVIGLNLPLLKFICSKLICPMLEGEALLLFCSKNYNKAAFALSSPRLLSVPTFSRFALVLRELDWTLDFIRYIMQLHVLRDDLYNDWIWCKKSRKLVFHGNVGTALMGDETLQSDGHRQVADQEALQESLNKKPISFPSVFSFAIYFALWVRNGLHNQEQLGAIWKKRLAAASCGIWSNSTPDWYWMKNPVFELGKDLGGGVSKGVKESKWLGETVAVADVTIYSKQLVEAEVGLLARVQHPNVVELMGCAYEDHDRDPKCSLVTEAMEQNLGALISKQLGSLRLTNVAQMAVGSPPFALPVAIDIVQQIVEAIIHIHKCGVLHRDIKPTNCLVCPKFQRDSLADIRDVPMYYTVKLIDFGSAKLRSENSFFKTRNQGTTIYMAPEVYGTEEEEDGCLNKDLYTWQVDVFSFGMTCYEVFTGKAPFQGWEKAKDVRKFIIEGKQLTIPSTIPSILKDLIERCWALNPADRPTFQDIQKELWRCKLYYAWVNEV